jgi:hypothetical protein
MMETGWPALLGELEISAPSPRSATLGTFPEVFRDTARPAIAQARSDVTMKRGLY